MWGWMILNHHFAAVPYDVHCIVTRDTKLYRPANQAVAVAVIVAL